MFVPAVAALILGHQSDNLLNGKGQEMASKFLRDRVIELSKRPTPTSRSEFEKERARRKRELYRSLGLDPMPAKTPLNARITGTIQREGFHIEKLVFESRPSFFVTGHVYVPDHPQEAKLPVIVNVNGHWAHKKDEDRIQLRCAFQALRGYLAIAIDSPGFSFEGKSLIERRAEGDHNDYKLVEGGTNATGYYVWDTIRALDYLATRPDTDMTRVGLTGASGGGLATLYAFAADDRFKAAVPVVYMSSLELAPDNGCLCNHVPGTCQIGDRSDVIAIQAPKPVLIMGAQDDGEFPPDAMRLTHQKMGESWRLFGKDGDVYVRIFPGGHDYSQPMREAMIGFFDHYLRGVGDGSPVPQPPLTAIDPEDRDLLALDPPAAGEHTMRDLSRAYLDAAPRNVSAKAAIELNGGRPGPSPLNYAESPAAPSRGVSLAGVAPARLVSFESEPGLTTPAWLVLPKGPVKSVRIVANDAGKSNAFPGEGEAVLSLDLIGTGELANPEMRYAVYAGRSIAFTGGWQIVRAAEAMHRYANRITIEAHGPISTQAAMWAGLLKPKIGHIRSFDCLANWQEVFDDGVSDYAVQPRAHLMGSLSHLRSLIPNAEWHVR